VKVGDLITLLEQDGYYILVERDEYYGAVPPHWWKVQSLTSGKEGPFWDIEPRMVLVSESR